MALSAQEIDHIADRLAEKMLSNCPGACGLSEIARSEMAHIMGVIKDQGEGDYAHGAERLRAMMLFFGKMNPDSFNQMERFLKRIDTVSTWVGRAIIISIVMFILNWAGVIGKIGFISWIKKFIGGS